MESAQENLETVVNTSTQVQMHSLNVDNDEVKVEQAAFQIGIGPGTISSSSLAFPPTFGEVASDFTTDAIVEYWKGNPPLSLNHKTFGQVVIEVLLDTSKIPLFSERQIIQELERKIPHDRMFYMYQFSGVSLNWTTLILSIRHQAHVFKGDTDCVPLVKYMKLVNVLTNLPETERTYCIKILERTIGGDITKIAEMSSLKNAKYVMSRLKLANAIPLLHAVFSSPTLKGKLTSIIRLIELYDGLWLDLGWTLIEQIAELMLKIFNFIMETTDLAKDFAMSGFNWVKAKIEGKDEMIEDLKSLGVIEPQAGSNTKVCSLCTQDMIVGCSLCGFHLCDDCRIARKDKLCDCPHKGFTHDYDKCQCDNNQDCMLRAYAQGFGISVKELKTAIVRKLNSPAFAPIYRAAKNKVNSVAWLDFDDFKTAIHQQLYIWNQCEDLMLIMLYFTFKAGIVVYLQEGSETVTRGLIQDIDENFYISLVFDEQAAHYMHVEMPILDLPNYFLWGEPYDKEFCKDFFEQFGVISKKNFLENKTKVIEKKEKKKIVDPVNRSIDSIPLVHADDHTDLESIISEDLVSDTMSEESSISSLRSQIKKYVQKAQDHPSRRTNFGAEDSLKENIENEKHLIELSKQNEKSFWDLMRDLNFSEMGKRISDWFRTCSTEVLKWFQENPFFTGIMSLIVGVASFIGINITCFSGDQQAVGILKKFTDATRSMYYAERGVSSVMKAFEFTMEAARDVLGISKNAEVAKFMEDVAQIHDLAKLMLAEASNNPGKFLNDGEKYQQFARNLDAIKRTYHELVKVSSTHELNKISPIWYSLNRTYEQLSIVYNKMISSSVARQEPVVIYLWGDTALGKSSMTGYLIDQLNKKTQRQMLSFTISKGPQYWNGYAQQDIIRIDDMNAVIGPEGDTDSVTLFNLASCAPYNPNMAAIEEKSIMATPKFLFVSSNHPTVPTDSCVQSRDAWERRRNIFVRVEWPGHENCPKNTKDCPCWSKITKGEFNHLRLILCDPCVSEPMVTRTNEQIMSKSKRRGRGYSNGVKVKDDAEIVRNGEIIDIDTLLEMMIGCEKEYHEEYMERTRKSALVMSNVKQAANWEQNPNVMLVGPPGTGKSFVFQRLIERYQSKKQYIKTIEEFNIFVRNGYKYSEPCTVIIDDLSLLLRHEKFDELFEKIQERYGSYNEYSDVWIFGANYHELTERLKQGRTEEAVDLIMRRFNLFETFFKTMPSYLMKYIYGEEYYTRTDIDYSQIDKYVQYKHNGEKITQETAVERLMAMRGKVNVIKLANRLEKRSEIPVSTILELPHTSQQFIDVVNNMSLYEIFKLLSSSQVKNISKTLTTQKMIEKLQSVINGSKGMNGNTFSSVDSLLLQAWNKGLLKSFGGECMVLKLADKMYYFNAIDVNNIECGIFESSRDRISDLIVELDLLVETISISDIVQKRGLLPHWVVLVGESISFIISSSITILSAAGAVQEQHKMFESQAFVEELQNVMGAGVNAIQQNTLNQMQSSISKNLPRNAPPFYPGVKKIKAPQFADVTEDDVLNNPARKSRSRSRSRPEKKVRESGSPSSSNKTAYFNPRAHRQTHSPEDIGRGKKKGRFWDPKLVDDDEFDNGFVKEYVHDSFNKKFNNTGVALETIKFQVDYSSLKKPNSEEIVKEALLKKKDVNKQICTDPALYTIIDKLHKNVVEVCDKTGHRLCSGLLIRGRCVRTVRHVLDTVDIKDIRIRTFNGRMWSVDKIYEDELIDRLDIQIRDKEFPVASDISNHFPDMAATIAAGSPAVLVTPNFNLLNDTIITTVRPYRVGNTLVHNFANYPIGLYAIEYAGHRTGYEMTGLETRNGDCGSYLVLLDTAWQSGKVIGMHIAASGKKGYASPLRRQHYMDKVVFQVVPPQKPSEKLFRLVDDEPNLVGICKIKVHVPDKTKLFKNIKPIGPKKYEPAILSKHDTRGNGQDLLLSESLKWCKDRPGLPSSVRKDLEFCMKEFAQNYVDIFRSRGVQLRKLTSTEALNKLKGSNCSEPINLSTSAGFPFSRMSNKPGKTAFLTAGENGERRFNKDPDMKMNLDYLMEEINRLEHCRPSDVIFQCYLKDEMVKLKKIYEEPKTRTIAAAPLHFMIVFRKYFYTAHVAMMENWDAVGPKIGISPASMDWHTMVTNLLKVSTHGIDLDFSGWDFSHDPFFIHLLCQFYSILYENLDPSCTSEDQKTRTYLYSKVQNFYLLVGYKLYRATGGIPSGYPGTSPDNSIINEFLQYYIYWKIMKSTSPTHANIVAFREDVCPATYGDDTITAISKWASSYYNGIVLAEEFNKLGFQAQAADKEGRIVAIKPIKDMIFLSRKIVLRHGIWTAPLQYDNLCKPTHYCHDRRSHHFWESPDEETRSVDIIQSVYESLLYSAAIDSREVFNEFYKVAKEVMIETDGPVLPTYEQAIQAIYGITPQQNRIEGLTEYDMSEILNMNWQHPRPEHFSKMSNRVAYGFGPQYNYTGSSKSNKIPRNLQQIIDKVNEITGKNFNSILVNIYPPGGEIPWHRDREVELDLSQGVLGITMKGDGFIQFRNPNVQLGMYLDPGQGYMMDEYNLTHYEHRRILHFKETISFTFRRLEPRQ